eukprot:694260-Rhodomonas_salina.2
MKAKRKRWQESRGERERVCARTSDRDSQGAKCKNAAHPNREQSDIYRYCMLLLCAAAASSPKLVVTTTPESASSLAHTTPTPPRGPCPPPLRLPSRRLPVRGLRACSHEWHLAHLLEAWMTVLRHHHLLRE